MNSIPENKSTQPSSSQPKFRLECRIRHLGNTCVSLGFADNRLSFGGPTANFCWWSALTGGSRFSAFLSSRQWAFLFSVKSGTFWNGVGNWAMACPWAWPCFHISRCLVSAVNFSEQSWSFEAVLPSCGRAQAWQQTVHGSKLRVGRIFVAEEPTRRYLIFVLWKRSEFRFRPCINQKIAWEILWTGQLADKKGERGETRQESWKFGVFGGVRAELLLQNLLHSQNGQPLSLRELQFVYRRAWPSLPLDREGSLR